MTAIKPPKARPTVMGTGHESSRGQGVKGEAGRRNRKTANPRPPDAHRGHARRSPGHGSSDHRGSEAPQDPGASRREPCPQEPSTEKPRPESQDHRGSEAPRGAKPFSREGRKGHWMRAENGRGDKLKPQVPKQNTEPASEVILIKCSCWRCAFMKRHLGFPFDMSVCSPVLCWSTLVWLHLLSLARRRP